MPNVEAYERARDGLERRGPGRMVPDLARITRLAELLGDPQRGLPSVHVTGTNGKGSVVRMVGALCSAAGITAGTYTSPHLQSVRERFGVAGRSISPARFAEVYDEVAVLADLVDEESRRRDGAGADQVTYFEFLTAMAYWWFADTPVDVAVVEVGMGGRWDATNLLRGDVAVINAVAVDHPQLGADPAEIAGEKVGIVKAGTHVVSAPQTPEVTDVVRRTADTVGASAVWTVGADVAVVSRSVAIGGQLLALRVGDRVVDDVLLPLFGAHQAENAALALGAFAALTGAAFDDMEDDVIRHGLQAVVVPGRMEIVHREPTVLLDGAHNPHAAAALAAAVEESFGFRELVLVVACLEGKDLTGILTALRGAASHVVVTTVPSPRAVPVTTLHDAAVAVWEGTGVAVEAAADLDEAVDLALGIAAEGDGVLVTGSLHTVGAARQRFLPVDDVADDDAVVVEPADEPDEAFDPLGEVGLDGDE